MEKIKCPFCGEEINASSKFCPNCGSELDSFKQKQQEETYFPHETPNDSSWANKWKTRDFIYKAVFVAIAIICIITHLVCVGKYPHIKNHVLDYGAESTVAFAILLWCSGVGSFAFGYFSLWMLLKFRVTIGNIDGYDVVVATGLYDRLIVDGEVQVKRENPSAGIFRRYPKALEGKLPNNKKIWATINSYFGYAVMGEGDSKKIN